VDREPYKIFDIQITYIAPTEITGQSSVTVADGAPVTDIDGPGLIDQIVLTPAQQGDPTLIYEHWQGMIFPNPDWEVFHIETPGNLRQVVIDTISIPEPATMALMGAGGLLAVRRRRRSA
jgi:hypothetical protein